MVLDAENVNMCKASKSPPDVQGIVVGDGEGEESNPLLPPGGYKEGANGLEPDKRQKSVRRSVQWNDHKGESLVDVLEFEPSEIGDSDEEDFGDSCICSVM